MRIFVLTIVMLTTIFSLVDSIGATTIDTVDAWDGRNILSVGEPGAATFGQTFKLNPEDDTQLESITFYIDDYNNNPDTVDFALYIYQWDGKKAIGPALFTSSMYSTNHESTYEEFTVYAEDVVLKTGVDYVWFISTSNFFDGIQGHGAVGAIYSDVYKGGGFVAMNNLDNFNQLFIDDWDNALFDHDLAFTMNLSPAPVPTIDNILDFYDESVANEKLEGIGRTAWLSKLRLCFMRKMLVIAKELLEQEKTDRACFTLERAHLRCDGEKRPPDFVAGEAVAELNFMITDLMSGLGCD